MWLVPSQRFHHCDTRHHRVAAVLADQHQPLYRGFPLWQFALGFRQLDHVLRGAASRSVTRGFRFGKMIGSKNC
jgi:hypothetical protein